MIMSAVAKLHSIALFKLWIDKQIQTFEVRWQKAENT